MFDPTTYGMNYDAFNSVVVKEGNDNVDAAFIIVRD